MLCWLQIQRRGSSLEAKRRDAINKLNKYTQSVSISGSSAPTLSFVFNFWPIALPSRIYRMDGQRARINCGEMEMGSWKLRTCNRSSRLAVQRGEQKRTIRTQITFYKSHWSVSYENKATVDSIPTHTCAHPKVFSYFLPIGPTKGDFNLWPCSLKSQYEWQLPGPKVGPPNRDSSAQQMKVEGPKVAVIKSTTRRYFLCPSVGVYGGKQ